MTARQIYLSLSILLVVAQTAQAQSGSEDGTASLLIVMDRSGSMDSRRYGTRPIKRARQAVVMVSDLMEPGDQLGLVVFNDSAGVTVPLSRASSQLVAEKARVMRAKGGTSFNAGLRKAAQTIAENGTHGVQVIFISDGDDPKHISTRYVDQLLGMGVRVHTIATGRDANKRKLCRLAGLFEGWCVAVRHAGLKATVAQMVEEARGRRIVADIRDVILPEEKHVFMVDVAAEGDALQLSGTWTSGNLIFHATSPSGKQYSTEDTDSALRIAGSAIDGYRILRVPAESGDWRFQTEARDVLERGEAYRVTITARNEGSFRLMPLTDRHSPGQEVEISLASCAGDAEAILFVGGEQTQTVPFITESRSMCKATFQAPDMVGLFPVAIDASGIGRLWTTLTVGSVDQVVAARDEWRPDKQPWDESGWSTMAIVGVMALTLVGGVLLLVCLGALIFFVVQSRASGDE